MSGTYKVVITDNSSDCARKIRDTLSKNKSINVVGLASDGKSAIDIISKENPDLLILDMLLPNYDGFEVLEKVRNKLAYNRAKVIITSALNIDFIMKKCEEAEVDYFFLKPLKLDLLERRVIEILEECDEYTKDESFENYTNTSIKERSSQKKKSQVVNILSQLNFKTTLLGYEYLKTALSLTLSDRSYIYNMTTKLYPIIAEKYLTTIFNVERNIRHAIEVAWSRSNINVIDEMFGYTVDVNRGKPTNKEFIAMITDKIIIENQIVE
ncbi:MAG: sporulation transcription factor Spo0A [Eubacteriales bacterium]